MERMIYHPSRPTIAVPNSRVEHFLAHGYQIIGVNVSENPRWLDIEACDMLLSTFTEPVNEPTELPKQKRNRRNSHA